MFTEDIYKKYKILKNKGRIKKMTNVKWEGNGCWNVEFEFDATSTVVIDKSVAFRNSCVIRVRDNATLTIGELTTFNNGCIITSRNSIIIGKRCLFGPNVMIFDHDHDYCEI